MDKPMQSQGEEQLTAKEEEQLTQAFKVATVIIHGEGETGDRVAALVLENQDLTKGLGNAVATVLMGTLKEFPIADDLHLLLGTEILMELTDLAIEAGAMSEDELTEDFIDQVVSHAFSAYLTMKEQTGELNPQELQAMVQEAEAEGRNLGLLSDAPEQAPPAQPNQAQGLLNKLQGGGA
ncbi:hypothetical protein [Paraferrimonas sedimenticola]|uniref:Uncharacterized protein n=1 Tax=Paraferrimonas sedimenticola TaxID=375674 RepID=A0AA37VTF5_9GAMM|nr:hypothetical protein [Paraferrimonas sedimenticola]GLP95276.1 hypothetical protein GCM10007895_05820 [Paraferrimonas sedimenticola]